MTSWDLHAYLRIKMCGHCTYRLLSCSLKLRGVKDIPVMNIRHVDMSVNKCQFKSQSFIEMSHNLLYFISITRTCADRHNWSACLHDRCSRSHWSVLHWGVALYWVMKMWKEFLATLLISWMYTRRYRWEFYINSWPIENKHLCIILTFRSSGIFRREGVTMEWTVMYWNCF